MTEEQRNERYGRSNESRFAFPESNVGIGYYVDGEQVSPEEFDRRIDEDFERIEAEGDE